MTTTVDINTVSYFHLWGYLGYFITSLKMPVGHKTTGERHHFNLLPGQTNLS